jgi:hypothetical protein
MDDHPYARLTVSAKPVLPDRAPVECGDWAELHAALGTLLGDLKAAFDELPDDFDMELESLLSAMGDGTMRDAIETTGRSEWTLHFDGAAPISVGISRLGGSHATA